ncbi:MULTISPECIES: hypothetical protein [Spirosoma]|uniref:Tetratricopeptide repeat protein n=1 Tax=Spirosoma sordidisoli TaxID=2502893 RepID=A0A4Q2UHB6_9BACT|nr:MULTISPECIES: hypothetical protein [Spirosoma]RYC68446.1 hypothetical protein EQG79_18990 [Spirosoma sordidisoli]
MNRQKLVLCVLVTLLTSPAWAQLTRYQQAMTRHIAVIDTAVRKSTYVALFNSFERIHRVETSEWAPVYYMAYCAAELAKLERDPARIDAAADRAEAILNTADSLHATPAEVLCIRSMLAFTRINVDFMERGPKYMQLGNQYLKQALAKDPENPRATLMLAQSSLFTPEQFGGDKKLGHKLLKRANQLYDLPVADPLTPRWGKADAAQLLAKFEKELAAN